MDFDKGFRINLVWETSKLIYFAIYIFLNIAQEIIISLCISSQSIRNLFSDVKVSYSWSAFELSELDGLIRLGYDNGIFFFLLLIF